MALVMRCDLRWSRASDRRRILGYNHGFDRGWWRSNRGDGPGRFAAAVGVAIGQSKRAAVEGDGGTAIAYWGMGNDEAGARDQDKNHQAVNGRGGIEAALLQVHRAPGGSALALKFVRPRLLKRSIKPKTSFQGVFSSPRMKITMLGLLCWARTNSLST